MNNTNLHSRFCEAYNIRFPQEYNRQEKANVIWRLIKDNYSGSEFRKKIEEKIQTREIETIVRENNSITYYFTLQVVS